MSAPGIGIGDLVNACAFIYDMCVKYHDAPEEFDEIGEKAKSTAVVLERINTEAKISGNLVDRAGPQGYEQLEDHLKALKKDSDKLKALVTKYASIHDEGLGRRFLFTVKESSGLTDLRRRIGLHEQMLQIWYMTLVYGSLRRLECGQEDILRAIEAIKNWTPQKKQAVRRSLHKGDSKPLERELRKCGLEPEAVEAALGTAVDYMEAAPVEQVKIESKVRSSTTIRPEGKPYPPMDPQSYSFGTYKKQPGFVFEEDNYRTSKKPPFVFDEDSRGVFGKRPVVYDDDEVTQELYRSKSTNTRRPRPSFLVNEQSNRTSRHDRGDTHELAKSMERMKFDEELEKERTREQRSRYRGREKLYPSSGEEIIITPADSIRTRRSSSPYKRPPRSPLLVVPDTGPQYRSASSGAAEYRDERRRSDAGRHREQVIIVDDAPRVRRSSSQKSDRPRKDKRDSSTHSYIRRRSSSRGEDGEGVEVRVVKKMDRIDSLPTT